VSATTATATTGTPTASTIRLTFGGAVRAEFLKLSTMRSVWWVAIASVVLALIAVGTTSHELPADPGDMAAWTVATAAAGIVAPWLVLAMYSALQATGEWSSGMYRVSFAIVPRRSLWLAAKATALAVYAGIVSIIVMAISVALMLARYSGDGATVDWGMALTWQAVIGVPAVCIATAVLAVGIGALVRSSGIAITALVLLLVVLPFAGVFGLEWLAHITSYLPVGAGDSIVGSGAFGVAVDDLGIIGGSAVLLAWSVGACVAASVALNRRDA